MDFSLSSISMLGLAGAALVGAILLSVRRLKILRFKTKAEGVVVSTPLMGATLAPSSYMRPVAEFKTDAGELRRLEVHAAWSSHRLKIGQRVKIVFDPEQPDEAYLRTPMDVWYAPIFAITLAIAVVALVFFRII